MPINDTTALTHKFLLSPTNKEVSLRIYIVSNKKYTSKQYHPQLRNPRIWADLTQQ